MSHGRKRRFQKHKEEKMDRKEILESYGQGEKVDFRDSMGANWVKHIVSCVRLSSSSRIHGPPTTMRDSQHKEVLGSLTTQLVSRKVSHDVIDLICIQEEQRVP